MARGLEPAGVEFIAENLDGYIRDLGKADKAQQGLGDSAVKSSGGLNILGGVITGVAMAATTFAIDSVMKVSQALVGLAQDSLGVATEFESSMAILGIAASATGLGMEDLSEAALAVGGDTRLLGVSASGAAESMTGLFKAGLTSQEVFGDLQGYMAGTAELGGTLRASIDLAAASSLDMVQASDLAAITLATFGHEAEEAGMSSDEWIVGAMNNLVRTADASVAEVEGLQAALANVGPTAAAFGFSMADVNTSLAILSTRGIQGSEAGTAIKSMFTNMMRTTPKVTGALKELGVVLYDNNGVMLSIPEIMGQFEVAMEGMTDQQKNQYIQTIAGTYGMKTMQTLLGEGIEGWQGMEEAIGSAATMQEQATARSQTLAAQQEALDGVMETLKIRIGTALLPALTGMTTMFSGLVDKYGPLVSGVFEKLGDFLSRVTERVGILVDAFIEGGFDRFFTTFEDGSTYVGSFLEVLGMGEETAQKVGQAVNSLVTGIKDLIEAFQKGGLAGFAEALGIDPGFIDTVVDAIDGIRQWFDDNGPAIESSLDQIGQVFGMIFESIKEVVEDIWPIFEEIGATFGETFEVVKEVLGELGLNFDDTGSGIETVTGIIIGVIEVMGGIIAGVLSAIAGTVKFFAEHFQGVWEDIRDVVQGVKEWFEGFKEFWTSLFEGDLPGAFKGLKKAFTGVWKTIRGTVKLIVKAITMPFAGLYKFIEGFVKGVIKFFKNLKKKLVGGSIIPDMMNKIEKVIDTVLEAIKKIWETIFEKILDTTQKVFESIERTVDRIMSAIEKIIDTIVKAISGDWEDFVDLLHELWEETWEDIQDAVDTIFSAIEDLIDQIAGSIESLWDSFTETLEEVWEDVWSAIETFVDTTFSNIETLIDTISGSIQTAWETFTGSVQSTWETVWGAVETFVDTTFNNIETLIGTISGSIETAWNTFTGAIQTTWETVWGAIETFVNTVFGNVQTAIGTISGTIETAWDTWLGGLQYMFETMFNALEGIVNTAMGLVEGAVETALSALADILAIGSTIYNSIMTIGHNIGKSIRDGVIALWNVVTGAITEKLEALGNAGAFVAQVWENVKELGWRIVSAIKDGLKSAWGAFTGVVNALKDKLKALKDALGTLTWAQIKEIGSKVVNWIKQGIISGWTAFVDWLKRMILGIFGSGATSAMQATGEKGGRLLMESIANSIYANAGVVVDALGRTMAGTEIGMMQAAAGFSASLGMVAPAMMAPAAVSTSTEVNIGPVAINNGMDMAEFEVRVRQVVSEAI